MPPDPSGPETPSDVPSRGPAATAQRLDGGGQARLAVAGTFGLFVLVVIRTAWIADDAFINFRTIENLLHGDGLRWNIAERVQTFTDPLWVLVLGAAAAVTHEFYYTSLLLSFAFTIAALLVYVRSTDDPYAAAAGLVLLTISKAFVDFSTSGL